MAKVGLVRSVNGMWKYFKMRQQTKGFFRGLVMGLAVGAAAAAVIRGMTAGDRGTRRRGERTQKDFGELLRNLQELFH